MTGVRRFDCLTFAPFGTLEEMTHQKIGPQAPSLTFGEFFDIIFDTPIPSYPDLVPRMLVRQEGELSTAADKTETRQTTERE